MTSYYLGHVDEAERRIREAVPNALVLRTHGGAGLSVANAAHTVLSIVFQPRRDEYGLVEIKSSPADIDTVIRVIGAKPAA